MQLRLRKLLEEFPIIVEEGGKEVEVSFSAGVVFCESDKTPYEMLYRYADKEMYKAKKNGKGNIAVRANKFMPETIISKE